MLRCRLNVAQKFVQKILSECSLKFHVQLLCKLDVSILNDFGCRVSFAVIFSIYVDLFFVGSTVLLVSNELLILIKIA